MKNGQDSSGQRLYQQVVEKMLVMLDSGEYPPGSRLPSERELCERFDVSRPTIREAIIALEVMGRVAVKTGSGVYILEQTRTLQGRQTISAFELTEARVLVEGEAAALAATMIDDRQIEALEAAYREMVEENKRGDLTSEVADRQFHGILSRATRNRVMMDIIENLWDIQGRSPEISHAHNAVCKKNGQRRLAEHKAILDAVSQRDAGAARTAMRRHFHRMIDALHDASEARAVEEVRRKVSETRKRFSLERLKE